MQISRGVEWAPLRVVIYGPEGIGKSTLASRFPDPLFIDVERGSKELDVARVYPQSWAELQAMVDELIQDPQGFRTVVVDTADWAEKLGKDHVCGAAGVESIGDKDYGALYQKLGALWDRFLDKLNALGSRMNVVLVAHSQIVHCDIPEETGTYDRYELQLLNSFKVNLAAKTKQWASLVLFCSYETFIEVEDKKAKGKASGGKRVIHTSHHPCWDAKQRAGYNLPEKMEFPADKLPQPLLDLIARAPDQPKAKGPSAAERAAKAAASKAEKNPQPDSTAEDNEDPLTAGADRDLSAVVKSKDTSELIEKIKSLAKTSEVKKSEIEAAAVLNRMYPEGTKLEAFNEVSLQRIITNWDKVVGMIKTKIRK